MRPSARRGDRRRVAEGAQQRLADQTALRRLPEPDDIANAIVFLASDKARSITGQTLDVNSGQWFA